MSWMHNSAKNNYRLLISPLSPRTVFSGLTLWRHHSWSVTSCVRVVLALWCHNRRLLLHVQIGIKAIFISEQQPWISISHQPVFTAQRVRMTCHLHLLHDGWDLLILQILWLQSFWPCWYPFMHGVHQRVHHKVCCSNSSNSYVFTAIVIRKVISYLSTKQRCIVNSWRKSGMGCADKLG